MKHKHQYKQKRIKTVSFSWACIGVPFFTWHKILVFGIVLAFFLSQYEITIFCQRWFSFYTIPLFSRVVLILCLPQWGKTGLCWLSSVFAGHCTSLNLRLPVSIVKTGVNVKPLCLANPSILYLNCYHGDPENFLISGKEIVLLYTY